MADKVYGLKTILSCTDRLSPTLNKLGPKYENLAKKVRTLNQASQNLGHSLTGFASGVMAPLSIAAGALGVSIVGSTKAFAGYADRLDAVAQQANVTYGALQNLRYAAAVNGSSAETMDSALVKLNKTLYDAANGKNKDAALLFKTLGISLKDANGNIRKSADVMPQLAEAFRLNTDQATRTRMAMDLFGKSGTELLPLMTQGAAGFEAMAKRAEELGIVVSDDAVKAGGQLNNTMTEMGMALNSTVGEISKALLPIVVQAAEAFMRWTKANREIIASKIAEYVQKFSEYLANVDWDRTLLCVEAIAKGFVAWKLLPVAKGLLQVAAAMKLAFGGPWAIAISLAAGGIVWLLTECDGLRNALINVGEAILKFLVHPWESLKTAAKAAIDFVLGIVPPWLISFFTGKTNVSANFAKASTDAVAMNASGTVSGRMTVDVNNGATGETTQQYVPLTGGIQVSGNPGVMRPAYGYGAD